MLQTPITELSTIYVGDPDIPIGMTVSGYRRTRPQRLAWWRSLLGLA